MKVVFETEAISEGVEGILLESMLEGMAEYYSAELSEKVVHGLTENALKCKYNGGTLPIGYTVDEISSSKSIPSLHLQCLKHLRNMQRAQRCMR